MCNYKQISNEETEYLKKTLDFIKSELDKELPTLSEFQRKLISSRKNMWQEASHSSNDFDKVPEMNLYLSEISIKSSIYEASSKKIKNYIKMMDSPYFGRIDFMENDFDEVEKIYIGMHNLLDEKNSDILVYDWRSPVASMFYEGELGKASYKSPSEIVTGNISLKRQYKIESSKLIYFFDSSLQISDSILQEVLSKNSSEKMKNIVQTIQKDQDLIIRDTKNELLIVQGSAGSGKTSIALHRIAFLLYANMGSNLTSKNITIISPNSTFSKYISGVLPELGEENTNQITFDEIINNSLKKQLKKETRHEQMETLILSKDTMRLNSINFKGSSAFVKLLDRLIHYYTHKLIPITDVYYGNTVVFSKDELKNMFLNNKLGTAPNKRLKRIENMILNKISPIRKLKLNKIENIVKNSYGHELEVKSFSRLLSIKGTKRFMQALSKFTSINYLDLYKLLFNDINLFYKLSEGLDLPKDIKEILSKTKEKLDNNFISYEDSTALIYLQLKLNGSEDYSDIMHVVIDEAQDYYPLQYEVFKLLFRRANYTILGDFNQSMEKKRDKTIYDDIEKILHKNKSIKLFLNKSYRSSTEISLFAQNILGINKPISDFFERHENAPEIISLQDKVSAYSRIVSDIKSFHSDNLYSTAIICKTDKEAKEVYNNLKGLLDVNLANDELEIESGTLIIPSYMAKGLEFDAVIVFNASETNYNSAFDKRLLYIACTRALHRLKLYYIKQE